jgi:branched-subunit amino acid transport protein
MTAVLTIAGMAVLTYVCRTLPLFAAARPERWPAWLKRRLPYVGPAILAAMVAPAVVVRDGALAVTPDWPAYALCLAVALQSRSVLVPVVLGMGLLLGMRFWGW